MLTTLNSKQVIKLLEAAGWYLVLTNGSHHQFKHQTKPGLVTAILKGTLISIRKQAGWK